MGFLCRPILMYNEYVPAIVGQRTWQYQVLGYHDGMDVQKPVYIDRTNSFQQLYDIYVQNDQSMDYSVQVHYGLHEDDGKEETFWEKEALFTFVSFIQFREKKIVEYNHDLEAEESEKDKNIRIRAYYALDSNDSILVVKSNRYDQGMQFINGLHENIGNAHSFEISSSYSILAFDKREGWEPEDEYGNNEMIDKIELRIVESYPGSVSLLYDRLKKELFTSKNIILGRYSLLGMDDEAIVIENIPSNLFLKLYAGDRGILCNSNKETQKYAAAITTKLMYEMSDVTNVESRSGAVGNKEFCEALIAYIKGYYKNRGSRSELAEKKTLIKIANALGKIEYARNRNNKIMEYNFFTLFFPFYFFVQLHMKTDDQSKEYYDFLTYFNICTQDYDNPDRISLQNVDFNIRYFEMQTKYFTLYSAYIYHLKRLLNKEGGNKYEFILCPGMSAITEVIEFHEMEDDEYRLFKVEIAETTMYHIKDMLCVLGHEVAHFVGTDIRSRDNRYEHVLRMSSRSIVLEFQQCFKDYGFGDRIDHCEIWKKYERQFVEWIEQYIDRTYNIKYLREKVNFGDETNEIMEEFIRLKHQKYRLYTKAMKNDFEHAIEDMLRLQGADIFEDIIWMVLEEKIDSGELEYKDKGKYLEECHQFLEKVIDNFLHKGKDVTHSFTISKVLEIELYLLRECYADLISILVLNLNLEEYLETIVKLTENDGHSVEELRGTRIIARVAIVMVVMHYNDHKSEGFYRWENEQLTCDIENSAVAKLQRDVLDFMWMYIDNKVSYETFDIVQDSGMIIYDNTILLEIISYLLHCRAKFYDSMDEAEMYTIREFKKLSECSDVDMFYNTVMKLIVEYERDLYDDLANTANEIDEMTRKK